MAKSLLAFLLFASVALAERRDVVIHLPAGWTTLRSPWNFDGADSVRIDCEAAWCGVMVRFDSPQPYAISTVGVEHLVFEDWELAVSSASAPVNVGWLAARAPAAAGQTYARSVGKWRMSNWSVSGPFRIASVAAIGIEMDRWYGCSFENTLPVPSTVEPGYALYMADSDGGYAIEGAYERDPTRVTCVDHEFIGCSATARARWLGAPLSETFAVRLGDGVQDLRWRGGVTGSNAVQTAMFLLRGRNIWNILLDAPRIESRASLYCVQVDSPVTSLWVVGGLLQAQRAAVRINAAATGKLTPGRRMVPALTEKGVGGTWNGK